MPYLNSILLAAEVGPWYRYDVQGNYIFNFALLLGAILVTLLVGRIVKLVIANMAARAEKNGKAPVITIFLSSLAGPSALAIFAMGIFFARLTVRFDYPDTPEVEGFRGRIWELWGTISSAVAVLALSYFMYRLVDIIDYYLKRWSRGTSDSIDNMLVPIIRKSLRIFVAILSLLFILQNVLNFNIQTILAAAGVGGIAIALAAQTTFSNFFGSLTLFADRSFNVGERIKVSGVDGIVEDVGFRSTRIRTLDGHLVTMPNSVMTNQSVENVSRRPNLKRVINITLTYDTNADQMERALAIIQGLLARIPEINSDPGNPPRAHFTEFNDWSLNVEVLYWVAPADWWLYRRINQEFNLALMRALAGAGIEMAYPTQSLYLKSGGGLPEQPIVNRQTVSKA